LIITTGESLSLEDSTFLLLDFLLFVFLDLDLGTSAFSL